MTNLYTFRNPLSAFQEMFVANQASHLHSAHKIHKHKDNLEHHASRHETTKPNHLANSASRHQMAKRALSLDYASNVEQKPLRDHQDFFHKTPMSAPGSPVLTRKAMQSKTNHLTPVISPRSVIKVSPRPLRKFQPSDKQGEGNQGRRNRRTILEKTRNVRSFGHETARNDRITQIKDEFSDQFKLSVDGNSFNLNTPLSSQKMLGGSQCSILRRAVEKSNFLSVKTPMRLKASSLPELSPPTCLDPNGSVRASKFLYEYSPKDESDSSKSHCEALNDIEDEKEAVLPSNTSQIDVSSTDNSINDENINNNIISNKSNNNNLTETLCTFPFNDEVDIRENISTNDKIIPLHATTIFMTERNRPKTNTKKLFKRKSGKSKKGLDEHNSNTEECVAHGESLCKAKPNQPAKFYVQFKKASSAEYTEIRISGPRIIPPVMKATMVRGNTHEITYWPNAVGIHIISIIFKQNHIKCSPFEVDVGFEESTIWLNSVKQAV